MNAKIEHPGSVHALPFFHGPVQQGRLALCWLHQRNHRSDVRISTLTYPRRKLPQKAAHVRG